MQNNKLTSNTPQLLTIVVLSFITIRIIVWSYETFCVKETIGIRWEDPSNADLNGGRAYQPKPIFYYFSEQNSESCKRVDKSALLNKKVVEIINDNFLSIQIRKRSDTEGQSVGSLNKNLQQKLGVFAYPTFLVTLPNGQQIGMLSGYFGVSPRNLLSFVKYCQQMEKYVAGVDYLSHAQYDKAAQSLEIWLKTKDKSDAKTTDALLYCALANKMLHEEDHCKELLDKIQNGDNKDQNWPQPLVQYLLDRINATELIQMCYHHEDWESQSPYFIGMMALRSGNLQGAISSFKEAEKVANISAEIHSLISGQTAIIFNDKR
jgi:thioredoxin-related protein